MKWNQSHVWVHSAPDVGPDTHTRTHFRVVVVWVFSLLTAGGRASGVSVWLCWWIRLAETPRALASRSAGSQPLLTVEINPAGSRGIIHPGQLKAAVFFLCFFFHSNMTPAATPWFLWVHLEVFHYGVCLYNKRLNQESPKVTRVQ